VHCHVEERHSSAANLVDCSELLIVINQTMMHSNILHSLYVTQTKSLREQLFERPKKCFACGWSFFAVYAVLQREHHH